MFTSDIRTLTH